MKERKKPEKEEKGKLSLFFSSLLLSHLPLRHQQQRVSRLDRLQVEGRLARAEDRVAVERALDGDAEGFLFFCFLKKERSRLREEIEERERDQCPGNKGRIGLLRRAFWFLFWDADVRLESCFRTRKERRTSKPFSAPNRKGGKRDGICRSFRFVVRRAHRNRFPSIPFSNSPVPQHLSQHRLVQLEQHAGLGPPGDHQVAALGVGGEERHGFLFRVRERVCFLLSPCFEKTAPSIFERQRFFFPFFFFASSLPLLSLSNSLSSKERASPGGCKLELRGSSQISQLFSSSLAQGTSESAASRAEQKSRRENKRFHFPIKPWRVSTPDHPHLRSRPSTPRCSTWPASWSARWCLLPSLPPTSTRTARRRQWP